MSARSLEEVFPRGEPQPPHQRAQEVGARDTHAHWPAGHTATVCWSHFTKVRVCGTVCACVRCGMCGVVCVHACDEAVLTFHVSSSPSRGAPGRLMKLEDLQMLLDDFSIPLQIGTSSPSDSVS